MKIIVDEMPEKPEKCKLHGEKIDDKKYKCRVTGNLCPMGVGQSCRVLRPLSHTYPYINCSR